jgi:adenylate cyclase
MIAIYGWSDDPDNHRRAAIDLARRALKVAGDDATALSYAATITAGLEGDHPGAVALVERAIAINPGSAEAWLVRGILQVRLGDPELAVQHLEQAMRLDPMGPSRAGQITWIGVARFRQGRFAAVIELEKEAVQLTDVPIGYLYLAASYGHLGQTAAAREALARYRLLSPLPIDAYARSSIVDSAHLELFLEGLGRAEAPDSGEIGASP